MDDPAPKKPPRGLNRLDARQRASRERRALARLVEGLSHQEIAEKEGMSREGVRKMIQRALRKAKVDAKEIHAHVQLARLGMALRLTSERVAAGELKAVKPMLSVIAAIDKYQGFGAKRQEPEDVEVERFRTIARFDDIVLRERQALAAPEAPAAMAAEPPAGAPASADGKPSAWGPHLLKRLDED